MVLDRREFLQSSGSVLGAGVLGEGVSTLTARKGSVSAWLSFLNPKGRGARD